MIGHPVAPQRAFQHQRQLLAYPFLANELGQPFRPQRALDQPVVGIGERGDHPLLAGLRTRPGWTTPPC